MAVSQYELDAILDHCRSLIDAADEFDAAAGARADKASSAKTRWEGPFRREFNDRSDYESSDLDSRVRGFRTEADQWAQIWADTVNKINTERQQAAVDQISSNRGFGESFVDVFVGDDSHEQVRSVEPVSVPSEATRFAATGGLESF